ncbi:MAG: hypothetical protein K6G22_01315 [Lachnospiraceae bacterium]|nr:hypothetical protein [Lachnospiraceae bacterium]
MKTKKSKLIFLIATLLILVMGSIVTVAAHTSAKDASTKDASTKNASEDDADTSDVNRGLSGKKGQSSDDESKAQTSVYAEPVEIYDGHLDTVVLIYMVGSNLESQNGLGTMDIHEICEAYKNSGRSDQPVKFVIQTGGANEWYPDFKIPADKSARYEVDGEDLVLKQEFELSNMANPGTLADFIAWGMASYPADRYGLILWDHGGGSVLGFGADEVHSGSMMRLQQLKKAFETAGGHFDFIGFDACLMGTVETAYMLKPFADYMIASEEMEPGNGWFYTNWVSILLKDPKASVETFGTQIVDDFADTNEKAGDIYTLSLIDLSKIDAVYDKLVAFAGQSEKALEDDEYSTLSKARSDARSFGNGGYEQIDIIDYVDRSGVSGGDDLKSSVEDAIIHFKTNMKGANGLAMYYPYDHLDQFGRMNQLLESLKFDQSYRNYFSGFCTVMAQTDADTKSGAGYSEEDWYRPDMERSYEQEALAKLPALLPYTQLGDKTVVDITKEDLDKMTFLAMEVWLDTGSGYMEMGQDHCSEFVWFDSSLKNPEKELLDRWTDDTDESRIVADFDNIWITINNNFVPFYMQDAGMKTNADGEEYAYEYGYVPAILERTDKKTKDVTEEYVWIRVEILSDPVSDDPSETTGSARVYGYWVYDDMEFEGGDSVRNLQQFKEGDELSFVTYAYDYDGEEEGACQMGNTITVPKDGLTVGYSIIEGASTIIHFVLEDVYKNTYYTDWVRIE